MRILTLAVLSLMTIIEVGPIPILGMLLLWVVAFRPLWFYRLVCKIYGKNPQK